MKTIANTAEIDIISVDYFLGPFAPYPVQVVQALAVLLSLVNDYGYKPGQIYIGGDSFGGCSSLLLERYLRREGSFLLKDIEGRAPTATGLAGNILLSVCIC